MLQKALDAYKLWQTHYTRFPRLLKFSLGTKIDGLFTGLIENLFLAGYAHREEKIPFVIRASTKLDLLKFFVQAAWEVKCLDHKQYAAMCVPLNEIGKDIGNWQDYLKRKQPAL